MKTSRRPQWVVVSVALTVVACQNPGLPPASAGAGAAMPAATPLAHAADVVAHPDPLAALKSADPTLAANKRAVFDMWCSIVDAGHTEMADDLLTEGYVQHSPVLRTGRKAFKEIFSVVPRREIPELVEPPLVASIAEGNLVVMALLERMPARDGVDAYTTTHFNLFRIEGGRLAEHWHSVQTAPGQDVPLPEDGGPQPVKGVSGEAQLALLESADPRLASNNGWSSTRGVRSSTQGTKSSPIAISTRVSSSTIRMEPPDSRVSRRTSRPAPMHRSSVRSALR